MPEMSVTLEIPVLLAVVPASPRLNRFSVIVADFKFVLADPVPGEMAPESGDDRDPAEQKEAEDADHIKKNQSEVGAVREKWHNRSRNLSV